LQCEDLDDVIEDNEDEAPVWEHEHKVKAVPFTGTLTITCCCLCVVLWLQAYDFQPVHGVI